MILSLLLSPILTLITNVLHVAASVSNSNHTYVSNSNSNYTSESDSKRSNGQGSDTSWAKTRQIFVLQASL